MDIDGDNGLLPLEMIGSHILIVRGQRVMTDADLAVLYGVPTKRFNEAVKRNAGRFPSDFMFALTAEEFAALRSQIATSKAGRGGRRHLPHVFTEHGALMAAAVLNSERAVEVSIHVVRAFVHLRQLAAGHTDLAQRLGELEQQTEALAMQHDTFSRNTRAQLRQVFETLRQLTQPAEPPSAPKRPIGFILPSSGETSSGNSNSNSRNSRSHSDAGHTDHAAGADGRRAITPASARPRAQRPTR